MYPCRVTSHFEGHENLIEMYNQFCDDLKTYRIWQPLFRVEIPKHVLGHLGHYFWTRTSQNYLIRFVCFVFYDHSKWGVTRWGTFKVLDHSPNVHIFGVESDTPNCVKHYFRLGYPNNMCQSAFDDSFSVVKKCLRIQVLWYVLRWLCKYPQINRR